MWVWVRVCGSGRSFDIRFIHLNYLHHFYLSIYLPSKQTNKQTSILRVESTTEDVDSFRMQWLHMFLFSVQLQLHKLHQLQLCSALGLLGF